MRFKLIVLTLFFVLSDAAFAQQSVVIQTNSRDEVIHLIDTNTREIVGQIDGIPVNHGAAAAPDGSELYFSSEAKFTLDVVNSATLEIEAEIGLSGRPNNISIGRDGRYVYVGIMQEPGGIDVIDTRSRENTYHIDTGSRVHNTYVTPDGLYVVAGTFGGEGNLDVFSTDTWERAFQLYPPTTSNALDGIRPMAFNTHPDGSTKNIYVQISNIHGFAVVDFNKRIEIGRVILPDVPLEERDPPPYNAAPAHGIGVAPDGETLWVCSRWNGIVYAYSLPDMAYLGGVKVGSHPDWITFSPDSKYAYSANGASDDVSVIDIERLVEIERIKVGSAPKRNITAVLDR
ncbi:MAG: beta-propeller fold lactonase family protein [Gammaproteobacteria bacterium]|nr:beta-propeller fold lactonase family protein [Gammaproteobacteria bacterium]